MVYAFVKIHKIYMFTVNFTTIAESRVFCQKQGSKEKEPFDFVFNQKAFFSVFIPAFAPVAKAFSSDIVLPSNHHTSAAHAA